MTVLDSFIEVVKGTRLEYSAGLLVEHDICLVEYHVLMQGTNVTLHLAILEGNQVKTNVKVDLSTNDDKYTSYNRLYMTLQRFNVLP